MPVLRKKKKKKVLKKKAKKKVKKKAKKKSKRRPVREKTLDERVEYITAEYAAFATEEECHAAIMELFQEICEELDNIKAELKREKAKKSRGAVEAELYIGRAEKQALEVAQMFFSRSLNVEVREEREDPRMYSSGGISMGGRAVALPTRMQVQVTSDMTPSSFDALRRTFRLDSGGLLI